VLGRRGRLVTSRREHILWSTHEEAKRDRRLKSFDRIPARYGWRFTARPARIAIHEEAVARADTLNDITLGYETRQKLVEAALFGGRPDLMLVAFSWCVAAFDTDPDQFDAHDFLWKGSGFLRTWQPFPNPSFDD